MFKWGCLFCEEVLYLNPDDRFARPAWGKQSNQVFVPEFHRTQGAMFLKIDVPKLRLLSTEAKQGLGASDEETNPAIGKFKDLSSFYDWPSEDTVSD